MKLLKKIRRWWNARYLRHKPLVVIDRAKWRTGGDGTKSTGKGHTLLLNPRGYMCCLGFACTQHGITVDELKACNYPGSPAALVGKKLQAPPSDVVKQLAYVGPFGAGDNTRITCQLIAVNDSGHTTAAEKEVLLQEKLLDFGKHAPFRVEFIGEYPTETGV